MGNAVTSKNKLSSSTIIQYLIHIRNINANSSSLIGYTPNINRVLLKKVHYFSNIMYVEQSCTADRTAFLIDQHGIQWILYVFWKQPAPLK